MTPVAYDKSVEVFVKPYLDRFLDHLEAAYASGYFMCSEPAPCECVFFYLTADPSAHVNERRIVELLDTLGMPYEAIMVIITTLWEADDTSPLFNHYLDERQQSIHERHCKRGTNAASAAI